MSVEVYHERGETVKTEKSLAVFAKLPEAGKVKTRLAAATSSEWAARVAAAFLGDTLDRLAVLALRRFLVHTPDDAGSALGSLAAGRYTLMPQGSGDLGERLARFVAEHAPCVIVGSDSPTLPPALVEEALAELDRADVVLGPATDGGYYLVGCRQPCPSLFAGIDWGSASVLSQTLHGLPVGVRLRLLPPWYDVDSLDDWQVLLGHLAALRRAGTEPGTPRTEALALG